MAADQKKGQLLFNFIFSKNHYHLELSAQRCYNFAHLEVSSGE